MTLTDTQPTTTDNRRTSRGHAAALSWVDRARRAGFTVTVRATTIELHKHFCPLDRNQFSAVEWAMRVLFADVPTTHGSVLRGSLADDAGQRASAIETGNVRITVTHVSKPFARGVAKHAQSRVD